MLDESAPAMDVLHHREGQVPGEASDVAVPDMEVEFLVDSASTIRSRSFLNSSVRPLMSQQARAAFPSKALHHGGVYGATLARLAA